MTLRQRIRLYQQLATLTRAGVPMVKGLERLEQKSPWPELKQLYQVTLRGGSAGEAFTAAGFSPFECHFIEVGAQSAQLEIVFQHLAEYWIHEADLRDAIIVQLAYPLLVLHLSIFVSAIPGMISGGTIGYIIALVVNLLWLYVSVGLVGLVIYGMNKTEAGKRFWMVWPVVGFLMRTTFAYRWITALRLEYSAGIPLPNAVADAWRSSNFPGYNSLAVESYDRLRDGEELSALMQHWPWLPRDWVDFVETGEISGALESTFQTLSEEAAKASALAQKQMRSWMPKILYFAILILTAVQIFGAIWAIVLKPLQEVTNALNSI